MLAVILTEFCKFKTTSSITGILGGSVVTLLAFGTLKSDDWTNVFLF
jgi:hypothetical protein